MDETNLTVKELTTLLSKQLNSEVKDEFGDFPDLIVYAENMIDKQYDLNVIFAPLSIDDGYRVGEDRLREVLNWARDWVQKTVE